MTLKIYFASNTSIADHPCRYEEYNGHMPPVRHYDDIFFTGETKSDKALLHAAHLKIAQLVASNDTINGLHFNFGNNAVYGTFVEVVDILKTEGAKTFVSIDNELWLYNFAPQLKDQEFPYFLCGTVAFSKQVTILTQLKNHTVSAWHNGKEIVVSFVLFVTVVLISQYKSLRS